MNEGTTSMHLSDSFQTTYKLQIIHQQVKIIFPQNKKTFLLSFPYVMQMLQGVSKSGCLDLP